MKVGDGDIGSILPDRIGAIMFASGVSNSSCVDVDEFKREQNLLSMQDQSLCIFYFSTLSIYTKSTPYVLHKIKMERYIRSNFNNYNIIRLGNITWGNNPHTFINFIKGKKERGEPFELLDEYRYVIDEETLLLVVNSLPLKGQHEINVFSRMAKVKDLC